ncbi:MAG: Cu2+-exporting ATPase [Gammaproteobacteria bacterium]|jgi:Cu2+-exporting ATPase
MNSIVSELENLDSRVEPKNASHCFHCGLPVPKGLTLTVDIEGLSQPMCCHGCEAVARAIVDAGHEHFYQVRTSNAPTRQELLPEFLRDIQIYDNPELQGQFVRQISSTEREISLMLEGITCAACVWLNERHIASLLGVVEVRVNYANHRAWLRWDNAQIQLSEILRAIHSIGYKALPYDPARQQDTQRREGRDQLKKLAVAGIFGMQVMMISINLYSAAWSGMEPSFEVFFRWLSLLLVLPVMLYSAPVFFRAAWQDISHRQVGMNVPVALSIGIAFVASAMATVTGKGELYFDSIVMFVFFLLASRYLEWMARRRVAQSVERLAHALPTMANRIDPSTQQETRVVASALAVGDTVLIRPGETIPADGDLVQGVSSVDESVLNGESRPLTKKSGDRLIGGSINIDHPLRMVVTSVGADTLLAGIQRMIDKAQSTKSPVAQLADRVASRFIIAVLLTVTGVAIFWFIKSPERWLEITLASLIVTCPCALSLATPTAISTAVSRLQGKGLLVTHALVLDVLDRVTHVVFDKTGTLTEGKPALVASYCDAAIDDVDCLTIAAALECYSEHPLARALVNAANEQPSSSHRLLASHLVNHPGGGMRGTIDGEDYAIGSIVFVRQQTGAKMPNRWLKAAKSSTATTVVLANSNQVLGLFMLEDKLRPDANELISTLKQNGKQILLMSGDREAAVHQVAQQTSVTEYYSGLTPEQKMQKVLAMQANNAVVLMVGDGVNDAPVLAAADVSIAMGSATSLAKTSADAVLLNNQLDTITFGLAMAHRTASNIRQNFIWALGYNFCAIPAAAMGLVQPWMAALGMSLSSLVIVLNALRLSK